MLAGDCLILAVVLAPSWLDAGSNRGRNLGSMLVPTCLPILDQCCAYLRIHERSNTVNQYLTIILTNIWPILDLYMRAGWVWAVNWLNLGDGVGLILAGCLLNHGSMLAVN